MRRYARGGSGASLRLGRIFVSGMLCFWVVATLGQSRIQGPANKEQPFAEIVYAAVARGKVALPCDISPPSSEDSVTLVLWYKDESLAPIFTLDSRRGHVGQARHSSGPDFEQRAHFNIANEPAFLQIDPVEESDAGEYRCRVDFRKARSMNTVITLKVIVPPGDPVILDEDGRRLEGLVGRFNEGENLRLVCEVEGGKPRPVVTWWRDKRLVDDNFTFIGEGGLAQNTFEIHELKRSDFLTVLTCQASNNNVTVAAFRSITLDMNLTPLDVAIQPPKRPLSAQKEVELVCSSSGSRPPALITWWKSGEQLFPSKELQVQEGISTSSSIIVFTPSVEDNGLVLSCRAENPFIPGSAIEEGWKLDVLYKPRVSLSLGQNLKEQEIIAGRDVYLECHVDASPPVTEVTWMFEGRELATNMSAGVIVSNQSLVLQKVRRSRRGEYTCTAVNREGHGTSNVFVLRIKYAPVCKAGQKLIYGVSRLESVSVRCELEADPIDVTFHWRFNSSSSGKRLDLASYSHALTQSTAVYSPQNEDDYGFLLCWGSNEVGKQARPCNFTLIPAGPPDPVKNCTQVNGTESSVAFECCGGLWDGGDLPVTFLAELHDLETGRLVSSASTVTSPAFTFVGLPAGTTFRVHLHSSNAKGERDPTRFVVTTLRPAEKLTAGGQAIIIIRPILGVLVGIVATLVTAAIALILFMKYKHQKGSKGHCKESSDEKTQTLLRKDADDCVDMEGKGPDIIPASSLSKRDEAYDDPANGNSTCMNLAGNDFYAPSHLSSKQNSPETPQHPSKYEPSREFIRPNVTCAELVVSGSWTGVSPTQALGLPRPQGSCSINGSSIGRANISKGGTAIRPLLEGHRIGDCPEWDHENVSGVEKTEAPLAPGSRMESTV